MIRDEINLIAYSLDANGIIKKDETSEIGTIIWGEKFLGCASFTLTLEPENKIISNFAPKTLICFGDGSSAMIEVSDLTYDKSGAGKLTIKGRTLECILERRNIINETEYIQKTRKYIIEDILNKHVLNPENASRKVTGLSIGEIQSSDELIDIQFYGENVYDAIIEIIGDEEYGFTIRFDIETEQMKLYVLKSEDRTTGEMQVELSTEDDDIFFTKYYSNVKDTANFIYASATYRNGTDEKEIIVEFSKEEKTGWDRFEMFEDTSKVKYKVDDRQVPEGEFREALLTFAKDELSNNAEVEELDGETNSANSSGYVYGEDYKLGDKIRLRNENLGLTVETIISEIKFTKNTTETFTIYFGTNKTTPAVAGRRR